MGKIMLEEQKREVHFGSLGENEVMLMRTGNFKSGTKNFRGGIGNFKRGIENFKGKK